jgi:2-oxoglutarate dehydrogenase E2 component (dihydrolipoamide succinyltransferase)
MTDLVVPTLGESITEAIIGKWLVEVGQHVDDGEPVVDLETDKITIQLPAPSGGALMEQKYAVGDTVYVGDIVGLIDPSSEGTKVAKAEIKEDEPAPASHGAAAVPAMVERDQSGRVLSPSQRRLIREGKAPLPAPPTPAVARPISPPKAQANEDIIPMSPLRRRIAERLVLAQQSSASLTTFNEVDMSAIMALRAEYKDEFLETHGVKLGFMSFAVKASVEALRLFPGVNAEVRDAAIVYKKFYDIGIAVGTDKGLVVPVLRGCHARGFASIEQGIVDLAVKARNSKLVLDDLVGGTFTITNGGIYGSMMSTPLLNFPQTGILGLHNIVKRPVAMPNGDIAVRPMMYVALTYDHRVVDGKEAV